MKNSIRKSRTFVKTLVAGLFLASTIAACSNKDNDLVLPAAGLSVTHASYDTEAFDLFVNEDKANTDAIKFASTTSYLNIYSGKNNFTIRKAGKTDTLKTAELNLEIGETYSLFVANAKETEDAEDTIDYVLIKDNLTAPKEGEAKVRLVNMSSEATSLTLSVKDAESDLFENVEFQGAADFKGLAADTYTFDIKDADGEVLFSLEDVKIEKGKIYTLWTKGITGGTGDAEFGVKVIVNK
jgi:hypothetical protein